MVVKRAKFIFFKCLTYTYFRYVLAISTARGLYSSNVGWKMLCNLQYVLKFLQVAQSHIPDIQLIYSFVVHHQKKISRSLRKFIRVKYFSKYFLSATKTSQVAKMYVLMSLSTNFAEKIKKTAGNPKMPFPRRKRSCRASEFNCCAAEKVNRAERGDIVSQRWLPRERASAPPLAPSFFIQWAMRRQWERMGAACVAAPVLNVSTTTTKGVEVPRGPWGLPRSLTHSPNLCSSSVRVKENKGAGQSVVLDTSAEDVFPGAHVQLKVSAVEKPKPRAALGPHPIHLLTLIVATWVLGADALIRKLYWV